MRCRHHKAWPTICGYYGFMWCPDCGAVRTIEVIPGSNNFRYASTAWLYPRGHADVEKQLERIDKKRRRLMERSANAQAEEGSE